MSPVGVFDSSDGKVREDKVMSSARTDAIDVIMHSKDMTAYARRV